MFKHGNLNIAKSTACHKGHCEQSTSFEDSEESDSSLISTSDSKSREVALQTLGEDVEGRVISTG